jgi:cell division protein FtsN
MARDYAKRPNKKRKSRGKSKKGAGGAAWLLMGVVIGLSLALISYIKFQGRIKAPAALVSVLEETKTPQQKPPAATHAAKPKFEFYSLLPKMEVEVAHPNNTHPTSTTTSTSTALEKAKFRLQLASFKQFSDADSLKAKLALEGFKLEIAAITLPPGEVWYRVRTPVLNDRNTALNLQKKLQKQAVPSIVVKADEG